MSFTINQQLKAIKLCSDLGLTLSEGSERFNITYTARSLISLSGSTAIVCFSTKAEGREEAGLYNYEFEYSGAGSPLVEAEAALRANLM
jgi:hypothetical protein